MYEYDQRVTKTVLLDLIMAMEKTSACRGVVGDMGGTNQGLWNELGVNYERHLRHPGGFLQGSAVLLDAAFDL